MDLGAIGRSRVWVLGVAVVTSMALLAMAVFANEARTQTSPLAGKTVVLDAGHGGSDSGAVNAAYGLKEKDQTLDVAYRLKALLEGWGARVHMTRTGDQTLSNNDRYTRANATGADVLVSIHMNGSSDPNTDYTTTLFGKWRKDKELALDVFGGLSSLPDADGAGTIATRTPYSYASGVLLKSNMPATMAETVFITSKNEGRLLSDGTGARQQQIAGALAAGIEAYFAQ
jgi:N-acetylmuramoyl-L-alanine amidase